MINRQVRWVIGFSVTLLISMAGQAHAQPVQQQPMITTLKAGADKYTAVSIDRKDGPAVHYTISKTESRKPLVLYIQGSGCAPAFFEIQPGVYASTVFSLTTQGHSGDHAIMIVNKPYAAARPPASGGLAIDCSAEFNQYFTLETWVDHIAVALEHARHLPWVDPDRILVIGISEGAPVAAALAAKDPSVTSLALIGANGTTQLYDFIVEAYRAKSDTAALKQLDEVSKQVNAIQADPYSATKFAWGHPYRRWTSFMAFSAAEALQNTKARIYLVSGMADQNVPILSTEVLYSVLRAKGRSVVFRRIPGAGHGLIPDEADFGANMPRLEGEYQRIFDWFNGRRSESASAHSSSKSKPWMSR